MAASTSMLRYLDGSEHERSAPAPTRSLVVRVPSAVPAVPTRHGAAAPTMRLPSASTIVYPLGAVPRREVTARPITTITTHGAAFNAPRVHLGVLMTLFTLVMLFGALLVMGAHSVGRAMARREAYPDCVRTCAAVEEDCVRALPCACSCAGDGFVDHLDAGSAECGALRNGLWRAINAGRLGLNATLGGDAGALLEHGAAGHDESRASNQQPDDLLCYEAASYERAFAACASRQASVSQLSAAANTSTADVPRACGAGPLASLECVPHEAHADLSRGHVSVPAFANCTAPYESCEAGCSSWRAQSENGWRMVVIGMTLLVDVVVVCSLTLAQGASLLGGMPNSVARAQAHEPAAAMLSAASLSGRAAIARMPFAAFLLAYGAAGDGDTIAAGTVAASMLVLFLAGALWLVFHGEGVRVMRALALCVCVALAAELSAILLAPSPAKNRFWLLYPWIIGDMPLSIVIINVLFARAKLLVDRGEQRSAHHSLRPRADAIHRLNGGRVLVDTPRVRASHGHHGQPSTGRTVATPVGADPDDVFAPQRRVVGCDKQPSPKRRPTAASIVRAPDGSVHIVLGDALVVGSSDDGGSAQDDDEPTGADGVVGLGDDTPSDVGVSDAGADAGEVA